MAAPTNVRVFAIGQTTTVLMWSYSGSHSIGVYRSLDNISYSLVTEVLSTVLTYTDASLAAGTKYYYKLSDDVGVSYSSVVTVKTHACGDSTGTRKRGFALPRFKRKSDPKGHNRAMRDIEDMIEKKVLHQEPCIACIEDGAIVIDCSQDCDCWDVDVDTDINSITFLNCDGVDPCIHFRVPPGATVGICGWPQGHEGNFSQYTGDECTQMPVSGGTEGRTVTTGGQPPRGKKGSGSTGGGKGGTGCECIPASSGKLTVKCCSTDCSVNCGSVKQLQIKICGGSPPYSVSGSAGLTFKKQGGDTLTSGITPGQTVIVAPPVNSGSAVAGVAYIMQAYICTACASGVCSVFTANTNKGFKCDDSFSSCAVLGCTPTAPSAGDVNCTVAAAAPCVPECTTGCPTPYPGNSIVRTCDARTAPMIAANCNPCGVATLAKTITVTDAQGVSVIKTLTA